MQIAEPGYFHQDAEITCPCGYEFDVRIPKRGSRHFRCSECGSLIRVRWGEPDRVIEDYSTEGAPREAQKGAA